MRYGEILLSPYCEHVVALVVILAILSLVVELAEEVEGKHRVHVHHNTGQQYSQDQLEQKRRQIQRYLKLMSKEMKILDLLKGPDAYA